MKIPFIFQSNQSMAEEIALLDSGATENFITQEKVKELKLGFHRLQAPRRVYNVDGTENNRGRITEFCTLKVLHNGQEEEQRFFVTNLGKNDIILGYPWLKTFNPKINW